MDNEFQSKIDEIGTAFERWAKEVADRIVEAAKQGAAAASQARSSVHESVKDADVTDDVNHSRANGGANAGAEDPWHEWARMRKDTWNRWASGKFDKATEKDAVRDVYREAVQRWGASPFGQMCDELFQQLEKVVRSAGRRADEGEADSVVREVIGEFVDVDVEVANEGGTSEYAQKLIARVKELDQDLKPKKLVKKLLAELEKDLAKMKKRKK